MKLRKTKEMSGKSISRSTASSLLLQLWENLRHFYKKKCIYDFVSGLIMCIVTKYSARGFRNLTSLLSFPACNCHASSQSSTNDSSNILFMLHKRDPSQASQERELRWSNNNKARWVDFSHKLWHLICFCIENFKRKIIFCIFYICTTLGFNNSSSSSLLCNCNQYHWLMSSRLVVVILSFY